MNGGVMEPARENQVQSRQETISSDKFVVEQDMAPLGHPEKPLLFRYVTMLVSGLVLLSLLSLAGFAVLNHWLGESTPAAIFSGFEYYAYLYLLVGLVVFGALHVWMRMCVANINDDQPSAAHVFRAIFLTILVLTIVGSLGAMAYVGVDMLLGTGNYSSKGTWLIVLDSLQVIFWAALLLWYFKKPRTTAVVYAAGAAVVVSLMAVLLLVLPIFAKRDAVIDSRTMSDLSAISVKISEYTRKNSKLPGSLSDIKLDDKLASRIGKYEYQPGSAPAPKSAPTTLEEYLNYSPSSSSTDSGFSYKLCATFKTDTTKNEDDTTFLAYFGGSGSSKHPSGRHCFDYSAYGLDDGSKIEPAEPLKSILNSASSSYEQ